GMLFQTIRAEMLKKDIIPFFGESVTTFYTHSSGYTIQFQNGIELKTQQLILATNAFTQSLLPELDVVPGRGQIILTNEIPDLKINGIYHCEKGYIYFRNLGKRILIGGARNHFKEQEETFDLNGSDNVKNYLYRF